MGTDVLIIGAGAAGLYAASLLGRKGKNVIILEARNRTGGRIQTVHDPAFQLPVEAGAEYVHGDLQLTIKLLKQAGIEYYAIDGDLFRSNNGQLEEQNDFIEDEKELIKKLKSLNEDMSVKSFLEKYFGDAKHEDLRKSLTSFVEGYDAADASEASCFALLQELLGESNRQFRVKGGYSQLVTYLENDCRKSGCIIHLSTVVTDVTWRAGEVTITTKDNKTFTAPKAIITVPISILQSGQMNITPLPPAVEESIKSLGNTGVIKFILQFKEPFWKNNLGFVFSDEKVPTWWTQLPEETAMITGWMAGPNSVNHKNEPDDVLLNKALQSLANIFSADVASLHSKLSYAHVLNWANDPFTRGAYAYEKVGAQYAKRILNTPLAGTLFFAGEAFHEGPERGTVEAALLSAERVVELMSKQ
jgi:monoamine oxidase